MNRRLWTLASVVACSIFSLFSAHSNAADPKIGWERFEFSGNTSFSQNQLRMALISEPEFLLATHPNSDRSLVGPVVEQLLKAGYQHSGFKLPQIAFQAKSDGGGVITIDEGQRFRCGEVHVVGANRVDVPRLIERLTQPYAKNDSFPTFVEHRGETLARWVDKKGASVGQEAPVWPVGSFVKFGTDSSLSKKTIAALKDLGFSSSKARVTIKPNESDLTAQLEVELLDEGPNDVAEVFHVEGTLTNSPNDVLSFLELKPGIAVDQTVIQSVTKRLWECGRFKQHNVHFGRDEQGRGRLNIELTDVKGVPSLAQPLSDAALVFMRARTWLNSVNDRNDDISVIIREGSLEVEFVQSQKGLLIQLRSSDAPHKDLASSTDVNLSLLFDDKFVTYANARSESLWRASIALFEGKVRLETNFSAAEDDNKFSALNLSGSCNSRRSENEAPFLSTLNLSPADWSGFAYKNLVQTQQKDGRLLVTRETDRLEINIATGQIYHWESDVAKIRIEAGQFTNLQNEIASHSRNKSNDFVSARPVSSLLRHLFSGENWASIGEVWEMHHGRDKPLLKSLAPTFVKFVDGELLLPLDAFVVYTANEQPNDSFEIPYNPPAKWNFKRIAMQVVGKCGLKYAPEVFAEGTWPMSVTREACLVMLDRGKHTGAVLRELQADKSHGPLCDASIAFLLSLTQQKAIVSTFAKRSLQGFTPERFHSDVETMMRGPSGQWMAKVIAACESLSAEEIESLKAIGLSDRLASGLDALRSQSKPGEESYLYRAAKSGIEGALGGYIQR